MDAPHLTPAASYRFDESVRSLSRGARMAMALGVALAFCLCVMVVIRGLLGAFAAPNPSLLLILVAVAGELLASAFRIAWRRLYHPATRLSGLPVRLVVPSICLICVATAMSLTEASSWVVGFLWLVIVVGEAIWWCLAVRALRTCGAEPTPAVAICLASQNSLAGKESGVQEPEDIDANVMQQITRSRDDSGVEVIAGVLRAEFACGERSHNLHVAFCPPLAYEPMVVAHQLDGAPLSIKVGQSEIFGTRLELRRESAAEPAEWATICFEVQPRPSENFRGKL